MGFVPFMCFVVCLISVLHFVSVLCSHFVCSFVVIVVCFFGCLLSVFHRVAFVFLIARCLHLGGFVLFLRLVGAWDFSFSSSWRVCVFALRWATETYVLFGGA
jgi:hypothetical protein